MISINTIILDMDVSTREDVIHAICGNLFLLRKTKVPSDLYVDLMTRESKVSTFAGMETAIPHTFSHHINEPTLFVVRLKSDSFTWENEYEHVKLVFCLIAPLTEDLSQQITYQSLVFSEVANIISNRNSLEFLKTENDVEQIMEFLKIKLRIS